MKIKANDTWQVPGQHTSVLLHACCAPCSGAIVEAMKQHGISPVLYYCNPNIYPHDEYVRRRDECARFAEEMDIPMVEDNWNHDEWLSCIAGLENEPERGNRCLSCFKMRLSHTAAYAASHGFGVIATTLASSRWKDIGQIALAGAEAVASYPGVLFWDKNWRKGGLQERRNAILREHGFYNQLYCGCEFSMKNLDK